MQCFSVSGQTINAGIAGFVAGGGEMCQVTIAPALTLAVAATLLPQRHLRSNVVLTNISFCYEASLVIAVPATGKDDTEALVLWDVPKAISGFRVVPRLGDPHSTLLHCSVDHTVVVLARLAVGGALTAVVPEQCADGGIVRRRWLLAWEAQRPSLSIQKVGL